MSDPGSTGPPNSADEPANSSERQLNETNAAPAADALDPSREPPYTHTRTSGFWAAVVVGLVVLVLLIVFILENGQRASVSFMGAHGHLPEGVALLSAAVVGGLFVVFAAVARILQLRNRARGHKPARVDKRHRRPAGSGVQH